MKTRRNAKTAAAKMVDISLAAPQVVAHRVTRMAHSGPVLSERDRKEFTGMVQEKQLAFAQSFLAWNTAVLRWQMHMQMQWFSACLRGDYAKAFQPFFSPLPLAAAGEKAAAQALEPVRRKAVSNAKRLAKTPLTR